MKENKMTKIFAILRNGDVYAGPTAETMVLRLHPGDINEMIERMRYKQVEMAVENCAETTCEIVPHRLYDVSSGEKFDRPYHVGP